MVGACCFLQAGKTFCPISSGGGRKRAVEGELNDIRRFRDEVLEKHATGRVLEWMYYYVIGPPAVVLLRASRRLRGILNRKVRPFLAEKCRAWTAQYTEGSQR